MGFVFSGGLGGLVAAGKAGPMAHSGTHLAIKSHPAPPFVAFPPYLAHPLSHLYLSLLLRKLSTYT